MRLTSVCVKSELYWTQYLFLRDESLRYLAATMTAAKKRRWWVQRRRLDTEGRRALRRLR